MEINRRTFIQGGVAGLTHLSGDKPKEAPLVPPPPLTPPTQSELRMMADAQRQRCTDAQVAFAGFCAALKAYGAANDMPYGHVTYHSKYQPSFVENAQILLQKSFDELENARKAALDAFALAAEIPKKEPTWAELGIDVSVVANRDYRESPTQYIVEYTGADVTLNPNDPAVKGMLYADILAGLHAKTMERAKIWDAANDTLELLAVRAAELSGADLETAHRLVERLRENLITKIYQKHARNVPSHEQYADLSMFKAFAREVEKDAPEMIREAFARYKQSMDENREHYAPYLAKYQRDFAEAGDESKRREAQKLCGMMEQQISKFPVTRTFSTSALRDHHGVSDALKALALITLAEALTAAPAQEADAAPHAIAEAQKPLALEQREIEKVDIKPGDTIAEPVLVRRAQAVDGLRRDEEQQR